MARETDKFEYTATFGDWYSDFIVKRVHKETGKKCITKISLRMVATTPQGLKNQLLLKGYKEMEA